MEENEEGNTMLWRAVYKDGTFLDQYNGEGKPNGYENIDRENLLQFQLLKEEKVFFSLILEPGQKLIFRRRVFQNVKETRHVFLIGWQKDGQQAISYLFEDGSIIMAGKWTEKLFSAPNLLECEK